MVVQTYISGQTSVKIAQSVEAAVARGLAVPGELLPTVRELAAELRVSNATVAAAYQLLRGRGIVSTEGRRGTRVRHAPPITSPIDYALPAGVVDLADGNPDPALLPNLRQAFRRIADAPRLYGDRANVPSLLEHARAQLRSDGVAADHVAIVSGALDGIERVLREHLRPGDRVVVEDPAFAGVLHLISSLNLLAVPCALDDEGLLPEELERALTRGAHALIVTPRAQNPTGAALTRRRARELRLILRKRPELLVVEDDHAGPIGGAELQSIIERSRAKWAVVRSVSKSLGPDLRVAFLAGDQLTVSRVEGRQLLGIRWVSHVLQNIVSDLYDDKRTEALLTRASETYARRRNALIDALAELGISARGRTGLNVWVPLSEETSVVQRLLQQGWAVAAGERYRLQSGPAVRVTIARLQPADARRFAAAFAEIVRRPAASRV